MSYIGNQPTSVAFLTDQFNGTGSQTAFTMSVAPANTASVLVSVSGVLQDPSTYSVAGTTLTFSAAPPSGTGNVSARYLGIPASGVTTTAYRTVTEFTATASQTTFTPPSYTAGFINVYRNGVRLGAADYTASNGTTVVLASGATSGDLVTTESYYVSSVLNAIPATTGAVTTAYLLDGSVTQAKLSTNVAGNGPAFSAYMSATQTVTSGVLTKLTLNTEVFDTNNNFDNVTNYRFTPTVGGYYQVSMALLMNGSTTAAVLAVYKNTNLYTNTIYYQTAGVGTQYPLSALIYLNGSTDYLEFWGQTNGGTTLGGGSTGTFASAVLVRTT
jgi:hypothetical protein